MKEINIDLKGEINLQTMAKERSIVKTRTIGHYVSLGTMVRAYVQMSPQDNHAKRIGFINAQSWNMRDLYQAPEISSMVSDRIVEA